MTFRERYAESQGCIVVHVLPVDVHGARCSFFTLSCLGLHACLWPCRWQSSKSN
jgi:hypothetical protein